MALPIDPFLYVAFGVGLLAHRFVRAPPRYVEWATLLSVYLLLLLLGVSLSPTPTAALVEAIPASVGLALALLAGSALIAYRLAPRRGYRSTGPSVHRQGPWIGLSFIAAFVIGFVSGHLTPFAASEPLELSLYLLLGLVAFGLNWSTTRLSELWVPLTAVISTSVAVAAAMALVFGIAPGYALASTFAFGFYSLAGPLVAVHAGATFGFVAFLANFLRENLTMISSPWIGRRLGADGLIAMGGATSMDTTLYFVTTFGDPEAGSLSISSGLILTLLATLTLPLFLGLAG